MGRRTQGKGCAGLQLLAPRMPQAAESASECQCWGYRPWRPPEKSTHTYRHPHNMAFSLSLEQATHLEVNGKNAPHTLVATRLPENLNMRFKTRGSSWLLSSSLSLFFSFRHLFGFCTTVPKRYSTSLSARNGPEKIVRVRHWREPQSFNLQVGGMTGWCPESPSNDCFHHSP